MENHPSLNFLLTEGESGWYARCLEYDFVAQATTLVDLIHEIQRTVIGRLVIGAEQGIDPFAGLRRADDRYWEMFRKSSTRVTADKIMFEIRRHGAPQMPMPELRELRVAEELPA